MALVDRYIIHPRRRAQMGETELALRGFYASPWAPLPAKSCTTCYVVDIVNVLAAPFGKVRWCRKSLICVTEHSVDLKFLHTISKDVLAHTGANTVENGLNF